MDYSHLHEEAIQKTLELLRQGKKNILHSIQEEFSSNGKTMSEGQWDYYNKNILAIVHEHIKDEAVLKDFLAEFSLSDNKIPGTKKD